MSGSRDGHGTAVRRPQRDRGTGRSATTLAMVGAMLALALPDTPRAETLTEALATAYASNPSLLASRKELMRVDEQVTQAVAGWKPQASVTAGGGYIKSFEDREETAATSQFSTTDGPTAVLNLQVRQPIYNFYTGPRVSQAEETVLAQRARLTAVEQEVLLSAAAAYLEVLRAEYELRYSGEYERTLQGSLASARRQFDTGLARNSSVAEAEARSASASAQRSLAEADLASARAVYEEVIGKPPEALVEPEMPADVPGSLDEVLAALPDNPNLVAAAHAEKAALEGVDASFGLKLPDFGVQGQLNPTSGSVIGVMTLPLYNGTADPQLRSAKVLVAQRRLEMEAQRRAVHQTAVSAWQRLQAAKTRITANQASVRAARIAVDGTARENALGLRTTIDLLNNQLELFRAQQNLLNAQRDVRLAALQVLAAVGRLTARGLGLNVPIYDAERYLERMRGRWFDAGTDLE